MSSREVDIARIAGSVRSYRSVGQASCVFLSAASLPEASAVSPLFPSRSSLLPCKKFHVPAHGDSQEEQNLRQMPFANVADFSRRIQMECGRTALFAPTCSHVMICLFGTR
jgi:hypothetical protein